jgi:glycosyltransferase involved in cell wall biosynthesis
MTAGRVAAESGPVAAAAPGRVPVAVVIAAHNEADQIAECVASVSWAQEVIVVENDSTDATVARARDAGATVFSHPFTTIGGQRNAAVERATQDWILVVDADERGSAALGAEVARRIASGGKEAYRVPRRNEFLGREIHHGGWGSHHDRPVRLFRATLRYDDRPVHERVVTATEPGTLGEALRHVPYGSLDEYFAKLTRYSRDWARQHHARGRRAAAWEVVLRPPARFVAAILFQGGWRDGAHGVILAALTAVSVASKYAYLWAMGLRDAADR